MVDPTPHSQAGRFLALDAIRGVGCLSVLVFHLGYVEGHRTLIPVISICVDLFFVLSGFVIGYAYEPRLLNGMRRRHFLAIRAARFFPAMALGVAIAAVVQIWLGADVSQLARQVGLHMLLVPDPTTAVLFPLNGVLWSLFFEFYLNVVHALIVRRLTTLRLAIGVAILGCLWAWIAMDTFNWGSGWNWASFAGGAARAGWAYGIGLLLFRLSASGRIRVPTLPAIIPLALVMAMVLVPVRHFGLERILLSLFLLIPLSVLFAAHARMTPLGGRLAHWLGEMSYPLYTIHMPLLVLAGALIGSRPNAWPLWTLTGVVIVLLAAAVARFFERPALRWLNREINGFWAPRRQAQTA